MKSEVGSIFKSQVLSSVIRMRPIKDIREMSVVWQLPSTEHFNSPTDLIAYVLGKKVSRIEYLTDSIQYS